ncbi:putative polysaccharide pyruvyl transferase [Sphingobium sp. SYK-6]|uniref:polysaccharide pyruvyl transferase family protein n=1 Tax=Sphingobium sp. (strain NBRC 103272 / SYK-6) TaxID=627192 RepID=UPI0002277A87|nr:polysaccharide pyruvyl transferase family protein [Sphingobium sp. SYK-6]BAK68146.1 putative polysaccharide pyruvyl transferase [Sphingobium sp. SYK-6]
MNHIEIIERQRAALHEAVRPFLRQGDSYALLDFPDYANVGDSAIWLGASSLLRSLAGRDASYAASHKDFSLDALVRHCPQGPVFIIGGGNFGDIYPAHQQLRWTLLRHLPDRVIVQLPQSIHFDGEEGARETAAAIAAHGQFHLMVRDRASAAFAQSHFDCPVILAPDCAFALGPLPRPVTPDRPLVLLLRSDGEKSGEEYAPFDSLGTAPVDWARLPPMPADVWRQAKWKALRSGRWSRMARHIEVLNAQARWRLDRGLALLAAGETVITDRLHGHILSILLGIPHVALDNRTRKVSAYHALWLEGLDNACVAGDAMTAVAALSRLGKE